MPTCARRRGGVAGRGLGRRPRPALRKLARSLQRAIDDGHLPGGTTCLPSACSPTRFSSAGAPSSPHTGRFASRRTLASRRGSGTWVQGRSCGSYSDEEALGILARDPYLSSFIDSTSAPIDLTLPAPRAALERIATVLSCDRPGRRLLDDASPLGYQPRGLRSFRRFLAGYLERARPADERGRAADHERRSAGYRAADQPVPAPTDEVMVENPSYRGLIDALIFSRARPCRCPSRAPTYRRVSTSWQDDAPRLLYLTPTCHNPTGTTLDVETRRRSSASPQARDPGRGGHRSCRSQPRRTAGPARDLPRNRPRSSSSAP